MTPAPAVPDRVQLPLTFDVDRLREDLFRLPLRDFLHYSVLPLTSPRAIINDVADYADGTWAEWPPTELLEASPYLTEIVDDFREQTRVTLVRLLRLAPGASIDPHADPTLGLHIERSVVRLTIPIVTNDDVVFFLNENPVPWQPGECWYLRFTDTHRTHNGGITERVHLSIDMEPNEWLRSLVDDAVGQDAR